MGQLSRTIQDPVRGLELEILLRESYEIAYQIFNHNDEHLQNPLSIVAMQDCERYTEGTGLYNLIARFGKHGVYNKFGIDLVEFLKLPREFTELILKLCTDGTTTPSSSDLKVLKDLDKQFNSR